MRSSRASRLFKLALVSATLLSSTAAAWADADDRLDDNDGQLPLPTGQFLTPTAATGSTFQPLNPQNPEYPNLLPSGAIASALSPNGKTLLVMTSGYNTVTDAQGNVDAAASSEYVFVFDATNPRQLRQTQVITPANTFAGLAWAPDGSKFYVSGGADDQVYAYAPSATGGYAVSATIPLGHQGVAIGLGQKPQASGIAVSPDGTLLAIGNTFNDSVSIVDTVANAVRFEYDLRPYNTSGANGVAGGEYVNSVAFGANGSVYAASQRDREVVVISVASGAAQFVTRIALPGSPVNMLLNQARTSLYVAQDNADAVAVIDTASNMVREEISAIAPPGYLADTANRYTGAATNNVALSPDQGTLYATNGGANSLAVIPLAGAAPHAVAGLVPTGWYPTTVSVSADGGTLWVLNSKNDAGANPANLTSATPHLTQTTYANGNVAANNASQASNEYVLALEQSGLLTVPAPGGGDLASLTAQVAANNGYAVTVDPQNAATMAAVRAQVQHVIYIVKENRTFDQILGDLANGANADPALTVFGRRITPNFHRLATNFVTLDNMFCSGEVSGNGWPWSTSGRETDWTEKSIPLDYASTARNAAPYDSEGQNSTVDVGIVGVPAREAARPGFTAFTAALPGGTANVLPGTNNIGAPDGKNGAVQGGYIWDAALRAGLTVRNYGFFADLTRYATVGGIPAVPVLENPAAINTQVTWELNPELIPLTDIYFRGFDNNMPDAWRFEEFQREFTQFDQAGALPNLVLLRYMHDHMGDFGTAAAGVTTPETQQADDDYAVGRTIDLVAHSKNYAQNTLIFVIEDDAQDGPDHMDAHRTTAYVAGPLVKQQTVVSTRYSTVNMLRTIEDVLGLEHLNLNTAYQQPMVDIFNVNQSPAWTYTATASTILGTTSLVLADAGAGHVQFAEGPAVKPAHDAAYWAAQTRGFDWSSEDRVPAGLYNRVLWEGLRGDAPYPAARTGIDLRHAAGTSVPH